MRAALAAHDALLRDAIEGHRAGRRRLRDGGQPHGAPHVDRPRWPDRLLPTGARPRGRPVHPHRPRGAPAPRPVLVGAVAGVAGTIAQRAPEVSVLATSREGLAVAGERIVAVPVLDVPVADTGAETIMAADAVQLCAERAPRPSTTSPLTSATPPRSGRRADASTGSRSPSSSPPPGCARCPQTTSWPASTSASSSSPRAAEPPSSATRHCAAPSTGPTTCSSRPSARGWTGCRSSRGAATWPRPRRSPPAAISPPRIPGRFSRPSDVAHGAVGGVCGPVVIFTTPSGADGTRTHDPLLAKQVL